MHEIHVERRQCGGGGYGTAEFWAGDRRIGFTRLDDGDLMFYIEPHHDGSAVVVGAHSLTEALAEQPAPRPLLRTTRPEEALVNPTTLPSGVLLIAGLATPLVAAALTIDMLVALLTTHIDQGFFAADGGMKLVLLLGVASLAVALAGPGRFSVDAVSGLGRQVSIEAALRLTRRISRRAGPAPLAPPRRPLSQGGIPMSTSEPPGQQPLRATKPYSATERAEEVAADVGLAGALRSERSRSRSWSSSVSSSARRCSSSSWSSLSRSSP